MAKLLITYKKSGIGYSQRQKETVRSLGLRKLNSQAIHDDTAAIRGMVFAVRHLVTSEEVADDAVIPKPRATVRPRVISTPGNTEARPSFAPALLAAADEPAVAESGAPVVTTEADDIEKIEGIGPKIGAALRAADVTTFAQIAAMTAEQIGEIVSAAGISLFDATTWPQQAALAASNDWDAFNQLTGQLNAGRRE